MLLVPTQLAASPLHGFGLFALHRIARGTPVWRFTPGFDLDLDPAIVQLQPPLFRQTLLHYGYIDPRLNRFILCCDNARFINHSQTPNLTPDFSASPHGVDIALRDIEPGEEITIDYSLVEGRPAHEPA